MATLTPQEITNVIPGESMTKERGVLPFEKPAKTSSPEAGVQLVFDAITEPRSARKLVKTLENGAPIDVVVDSLLMMLMGEGVVSPQALPIMTPALATMIEGMATLADIPINYSERPDPWTEIDEDEVEALVGKMTGELAKMNEKPEEEEELPVDEPVQGLMAPPSMKGI